MNVDVTELTSIESLSKSWCRWKRRKPPLGFPWFASIIRGIGRSLRRCRRLDFDVSKKRREGKPGPSVVCEVLRCWNGPCQQPRADWWANWRRRWPADPLEADDNCEQYRKSFVFYHLSNETIYIKNTIFFHWEEEATLLKLIYKFFWINKSHIIV